MSFIGKLRPWSDHNHVLLLGLNPFIVVPYCNDPKFKLFYLNCVNHEPSGSMVLHLSNCSWVHVFKPLGIRIRIYIFASCGIVMLFLFFYLVSRETNQERYLFGFAKKREDSSCSKTKNCAYFFLLTVIVVILLSSSFRVQTVLFKFW